MVTGAELGNLKNKISWDGQCEKAKKISISIGGFSKLLGGIPTVVPSLHGHEAGTTRCFKIRSDFRILTWVLNLVASLSLNFTQAGKCNSGLLSGLVIRSSSWLCLRLGQYPPCSSYTPIYLRSVEFG